MAPHREFFDFFGAMMAVLGIGVAYFAIWSGIRHDRIKREMAHKERLRALELGRPLPGDRPWLTPTRIGFLTGVIVPICVMAFAARSVSSAGYQGEIWKFCGIVSMAAVLSGAVVTCVASNNESASRGKVADRAVKSNVDEDLYDVVSARG